jgi:hypothetical protein
MAVPTTTYRVKIQPTFGMQARVRVWHRKALILDRNVWAPNVKKRAESIAREIIALDHAQRRMTSRQYQEARQ